MKSRHVYHMILLLAILLLGTAVTARSTAEGLLALDQYYDWQAVDLDWRSFGLSKKTKLPVYSAPFEDAWRGAKGKASVSLSEPFTLLASAQDGEWLLIEYSTDQKSGRVGWIQTPSGFVLTVETLSARLSRIPYRVSRSSELTDDPGGQQRRIGELQAGDTVIGLWLYNDDPEWACVETELEGQIAWAFTKADVLEPIPMTWQEGDTLMILEGVTRIGDSDLIQGNRIEPGDLWCGSIYLWDEYDSSVQHLRFPETLRELGMECIYGGKLEELRLPGSLTTVDQNALYNCSVRTIILDQDFTAPVFSTSDCDLLCWEVDEGNPAYQSIDGVLFSADGKTLISYPDARTDLHYDVPAGTETIATGAFSDGMMSIPLQTISLPVGLKQIQTFAFSGCGRLNSLTVPLTVTELESGAFAQCVSLERLSLPPGLSDEYDDSWTRHGDFSWYNGDNGSTYSIRPRDEDDDVDDAQSPVQILYDIWLSGEDGRSPVPVYLSSTADSPADEWPSGKRLTVRNVENGRGLVDIISGQYYWVDTDDLLPVSGDVWFSLAEVRPNSSGLEKLIQAGIEPYAYSWFDVDELTGEFIAEMKPGETEQRSETLPLDQIILTREKTGDDRIMGLLRSEAAGEPIELLDAPGGNTVAWTYQGAQALQLEADSQGEWILIQIPTAQGWIPADCFWIVPQAE